MPQSIPFLLLTSKTTQEDRTRLLGVATLFGTFCLFSELAASGLLMPGARTVKNRNEMNTTQLMVLADRTRRDSA